MHREKFRPRMGPDGGDGGRGGNVWLEATVGEQSLAPLRFRGHLEADNGQPGMGNDRHGRNGRDVIVPVPPGTQVLDLEAEGAQVADLVQPGQRFLAAAGGHGGRGNTHFATPTNRAPRHCEPGRPGQERLYELVLKCIADIGLVGYPNAGKSTLLGAVSAAHPEVAPYPFTTLHPHIGTVDFPDYFRLTVADIPGLVAGAHANVGLGHDFLRHIERTRVLVYVLDVAGSEGRLPWDDLRALQDELELYQPGLSRRTSVIAANKTDEPAAAANLATLRTHTELAIFPICALLGDGLPELLAALRARVERLRV